MGPDQIGATPPKRGQIRSAFSRSRRLLVEINTTCDQARSAGHKTLAPTRQREFATRYDNLVTDGHTANPDPPAGRKRNSLQRDSHNLAVAFETHRRSILRFMHNLDVGMTNNQAERDLQTSENPSEDLVVLP